MLRGILAGVCVVFLLGTPAYALTAKEKMETCKFGADDQKLNGAKRAEFIKKCMADEPAAPTPQAKKK